MGTPRGFNINTLLKSDAVCLMPASVAVSGFTVFPGYRVLLLFAHPLKQTPGLFFLSPGVCSFLYTVTHMPYKAKRPCKYPGCPNLTDRDYCAEHISQVRYEYEHYRRDPDTKKRYDSRWRKIRALYVKAHPLCEECLKHGRTTPVEQVHHIVPLSDGGTHDFSNLMSLCKSCHSAITLAATNKKAADR